MGKVWRIREGHILGQVNQQDFEWRIYFVTAGYFDTDYSIDIMFLMFSVYPKKFSIFYGQKVI